MNTIVKPLSKDGRLGFDEHGQLCCWRPEPGGGMVGTIVPDLRGATCMICNHGWDLTPAAYSDHWNWRSQDCVVHETCMIRFTSLVDHALYYSSLVKAGLRFDKLERIRNQYWSVRDRWHARHWYRVRLLDSGRTLKFGSRKHVHHLEIEPGATLVDMGLAEKLFADEKVTKEVIRPSEDRGTPKDWSPNAQTEGFLIHAHNDDKVREYILGFAMILGLEKKSP